MEQLKNQLYQKDEEIFELGSSLAEVEASSRLSKSRADSKVRLAEEQLRRLQKDLESKSHALVQLKKKRLVDSSSHCNISNHDNSIEGESRKKIKIYSDAHKNSLDRQFNTTASTRDKIQSHVVSVAAAATTTKSVTSLNESLTNNTANRRIDSTRIIPPMERNIEESDSIANSVNLILDRNVPSCDFLVSGSEKLASHLLLNYDGIGINDDTNHNIFNKEGTVMIEDHVQTLDEERINVDGKNINKLNQGNDYQKDFIFNKMSLTVNERMETERDDVIIMNLLYRMARFHRSEVHSFEIDDKPSYQTITIGDFLGEILSILVSKFMVKQNFKDKKVDPFVAKIPSRKSENDNGFHGGAIENTTSNDHVPIHKDEISDCSYVPSILSPAVVKIFCLLHEILIFSAEARICLRSWITYDLMKEETNENSTMDLFHKLRITGLPKILNRAKNRDVTAIDTQISLLTSSGSKSSMICYSFKESKFFSDILINLIIGCYSKLSLTLQIRSLTLLKGLMYDGIIYREIDKRSNLFCTWLSKLLPNYKASLHFKSNEGLYYFKDNKDCIDVVSILEKDTSTKWMIFNRRQCLLKETRQNNNIQSNLQKRGNFNQAANNSSKVSHKTCLYGKGAVAKGKPPSDRNIMDSIKIKCLVYQILKQFLCSSGPFKHRLLESVEKEYGSICKKGVCLEKRLMAAVLDEMQGFVIPFMSNSNHLSGRDQSEDPLLVHVLSLGLNMVRFAILLSESNSGFLLVRSQFKSRHQGSKKVTGVESCITILIDLLKYCAHSLHGNGISSFQFSNEIFYKLTSMVKNIVTFFHLILCKVQITRHSVNKNKHSQRNILSFLSVVSDAERKELIWSCFHLILQFDSINSGIKHQVKMIIDEMIYDEEEKD